MSVSRMIEWKNACARRIERDICNEIDQVFYTFSLSIIECLKAGCSGPSSQRVYEEMMPYSHADWDEITRTRAYEFCDLCDMLTLDT